jgi:hypothetical protein
MKYLGIFLIVVGMSVGTGYGIFLLGKGFFTNPDIGMPVRVAVPAVVLGLVLLLIAYIKEKFQTTAQREEPMIKDNK